jgi:hypothetical protein
MDQGTENGLGFECCPQGSFQVAVWCVAGCKCLLSQRRQIRRTWLAVPRCCGGGRKLTHTNTYTQTHINTHTHQHTHTHPHTTKQTPTRNPNRSAACYSPRKRTESCRARRRRATTCPSCPSSPPSTAARCLLTWAGAGWPSLRMTRVRGGPACMAFGGGTAVGGLERRPGRAAVPRGRLVTRVHAHAQTHTRTHTYVREHTYACAHTGTQTHVNQPTHM